MDLGAFEKLTMKLIYAEASIEYWHKRIDEKRAEVAERDMNFIRKGLQIRQLNLFEERLNDSESWVEGISLLRANFLEEANDFLERNKAEVLRCRLENEDLRLRIESLTA